MTTINFENNVFTYQDQTKKVPLLDCNAHIENKGRIPMQESIPTLLGQLRSIYTNLFVGSAPEDGDELYLIDILITKQLTKISTPLNVVELGANNGRLSYHLATLLGSFNDQTNLCCVCNSIGNESDNVWLDFISLAQASPVASMLASDFDNTHLCDNHFDIVVVNNSVQMDKPEDVIKEAVRLAKKDGVIIFYAQQSDLTDCTLHAFDDIEKYNTNNGNHIFVAEAKNAVENESYFEGWRKAVHADLANAELTLSENVDRTTLLTLVQKLNEHAYVAAKYNFTDIKCNCLALKEKLLIKHVNHK